MLATMAHARCRYAGVTQAEVISTRRYMRATILCWRRAKARAVIAAQRQRCGAQAYEYAAVGYG